ncbi:hypothetical protein HZB94_03925 [Candidatus Falkowbacteria bacterium]|nr:hypothetical protein [Candidatus Falkowbacteria bacterium]
MWIIISLAISNRLALLIIYLTTNFMEKAFSGWFWPLLGSLFMPWTTLWCVYVLNNNGFTDWRTLILFSCIVADLAPYLTAIMPATQTRK